MRLKTIWTLQSMSTMERLRRTQEWATIKVALKIPKRLRYWVVIQELAKATVNSPNVPATTLDEIMDNLDYP